MSVQIVRDGRIIVSVTGEIDIANVAEMDSALNDVVAESPDGFVVDMSQVSYIDGTGIRAVLRAYQRVRSGGGSMALVVNDVVRVLTGFLSIRELPCLYICETILAAVDVLSSCTGDRT